jgi:hypothetical protein
MVFPKNPYKVDSQYQINFSSRPLNTNSSEVYVAIPSPELREKKNLVHAFDRSDISHLGK